MIAMPRLRSPRLAPAGQLRTSRREPGAATLNGRFPPAAPTQSTLCFLDHLNAVAKIVDRSVARAPRLDRFVPSPRLGAAAPHSSPPACSATWASPTAHDRRLEQPRSEILAVEVGGVESLAERDAVNRAFGHHNDPRRHAPPSFRNV